MVCSNSPQTKYKCLLRCWIERNYSLPFQYTTNSTESWSPCSLLKQLYYFPQLQTSFATFLKKKTQQQTHTLCKRNFTNKRILVYSNILSVFNESKTWTQTSTQRQTWKAGRPKQENNLSVHTKNQS